MKIVVTGAARFIGSHMCEALILKGHSVLGVDSLTDHYDLKLKELNITDITERGVEFFKKDLVTDDLTSLLGGVEVVFHFAAEPGISSSKDFDVYERNNVVATRKLVEAAKDFNTLKLFVNISTSSVYGLYATGNEETAVAPASHYGVTKLAAEQLALSYFYSQKFPATSFRPFSIYGERERPEKIYPKLIASIIEDREIGVYEGSENHIRSYTYVGDLVEGLLLSLDNVDKCIGQIFNLGTDKTITTGEGIQIVEDILGKKAKIKTIPRRSGDQMETRSDITKARNILGYNPKVLPQEGLEREVEWVKKALKAGIKL